MSYTSSPFAIRRKPGTECRWRANSAILILDGLPRRVHASTTREPDRDSGAMLLMIDNYDSFTYNLVQYLGELGCAVEVVRNDPVGLDEIEDMAPERLVISPGPCAPNEAGISVELVEAFGAEIPILGVCLGHQAIVQAYGGHVVRAKMLMHGKTAAIPHGGGAVFEGLRDPVLATRYHSLAGERETLPDCFAVNAWVDDGE